MRMIGEKLFETHTVGFNVTSDKYPIKKGNSIDSPFKVNINDEEKTLSEVHSLNMEVSPENLRVSK